MISRNISVGLFIIFNFLCICFRSANILLNHILSLQENAKALIHWGLILCSIHLAFLKGLDGAELTSKPLEQSFTYVQGLKHSLIHWAQLAVNLNLEIKTQWPHELKFLNERMITEKLQAKGTLYPRCYIYKSSLKRVMRYKGRKVWEINDISEAWPGFIKLSEHINEPHTLSDPAVHRQRLTMPWLLEGLVWFSSNKLNNHRYPLLWMFKASL